MVGHPAAGSGLEGSGDGRRWSGTPTLSDVGRRPAVREGLRPGSPSRPVVPPALDQAQQEELKAAVEQPPAAAGIQLANWYWKVVHRFVWERFGLSRCRSSCLNWRHRLGFAFKRLKKRLVQGNESKREAFVAE